VSDCSKKTLQGVIRSKITPSALLHTDGWHGYERLVDVGCQKQLWVHYGENKFALLDEGFCVETIMCVE
jgi:transposase